MAILKADPAYKRRWLLLLAAMAITALAVGLWGLPALMEHLQEKEPSEAIRFIQILLFLLFAPVLPMAYYLYRVARRIQASGQCPPPGMKVIRDTEIVEGNGARRTGKLLLIASIILTIAAFLGMIYVPYVVGKLGKAVVHEQASNTSLKPIAQKSSGLAWH